MLMLSKIGTSSILHSLNRIIENSRDVGVKLPKGVLQQVEELEEGIISARTNAPQCQAVFGSMSATVGTSTRISVMVQKLKT